MRTIVHLSDIHMGRIDPALLLPLSAAIRRAAPDLVAVSGDFTQRARTSQFVAARRFLDSLERPLLVVPGNHDVPLWNVAARFVTPLGRYRRYIARNLEPVVEDDEMIVVGVNTARSWAWGEGRINTAQVDGIVKKLRTVPPAKLRIVVTHHPFDLPPGVGERRLLGRARMAMARLTAASADLFLAGHLHISHIGHSAERYRIEGHSALLVQAGTVSMRGRGEQPSFNLLRVARPSIAISRLAWDSSTAAFLETAASRFRHSPAGWSPA